MIDPYMVAELLVLTTLDHIILAVSSWLYTEPFIITLPSSQYDLNNVERNIKHQTVSEVDTDLMLQNVAFDQSQHCLPTGTVAQW